MAPIRSELIHLESAEMVVPGVTVLDAPTISASFCCISSALPQPLSPRAAAKSSAVSLFRFIRSPSLSDDAGGEMPFLRHLAPGIIKFLRKIQVFNPLFYILYPV